MSIISKPNTFTDNTTAEASEVNDNFDTIYNDYNGGISAANLATDAVTTAKIADSNVTTAKIADSNVTTAKIADANVTNAKLATGAGEPGGAWTSYSPTLANITIGNGTVSTFYKQIGKTVFYQGKITLGSTSSVGTAPSVTLPVTASSNLTIAAHCPGTCILNDTGTATFMGLLRMDTSTTIVFYAPGAGGATVSYANVTSTIPHTWANTDFITWLVIYEAA